MSWRLCWIKAHVMYTFTLHLLTMQRENTINCKVYIIRLYTFSNIAKTRTTTNCDRKTSPQQSRVYADVGIVKYRRKEISFSHSTQKTLTSLWNLVVSVFFTWFFISFNILLLWLWCLSYCCCNYCMFLFGLYFLGERIACVHI